MTQTSHRQLIDPNLIAGTEAEPRLIGSECGRCGTVTFPPQSSCAKCTSEDVHPQGALDARHAVDLDRPVLCAQGAAVSRGGRGGVRALRRRVHRAARRGPCGGSADRERSGAAGDRHADGADTDPRPRSAREADVRLPSRWRRTSERRRRRRGRRPRHPRVWPPRRSVGAGDGRHRRPSGAGKRGDLVGGRRLRGGRFGRGRQRGHVGVDPRLDRRPVHQRQERMRHRRLGAHHCPRDARVRRGGGRARGSASTSTPGEPSTRCPRSGESGPGTARRA